MIAICSKCGCSWETTEEDACTPGVVCLVCYWDLCRGDRVICVAETHGDLFPRVGKIYTVDSVQRAGQLCMVALWGLDRMVLPTQIRFVGRPLSQ